MEASVTVKFGDLSETIHLSEGKVHIPTDEKAFALHVAKTDGIFASTDNQGLILAKCYPGSPSTSEACCCHAEYNATLWSLQAHDSYIAILLSAWVSWT